MRINTHHRPDDRGEDRLEHVVEEYPKDEAHGPDVEVLARLRAETNGDQTAEFGRGGASFKGDEKKQGFCRSRPRAWGVLARLRPLAERTRAFNERYKKWGKKSCCLQHRQPPPNAYAAK